VARRQLLEAAPKRPVRFGFHGLATVGGNQGLQRLAPTRERADALVNQRLSAPFTADANDVLYQYEASRDYNPSEGLERIEAVLLAINSADDERNPPELGVLEREIKRVKKGSIYVIPSSEQTAGHATAFFARWWSKQFSEVLGSTPRSKE
jgi:homoserine O-acetyltransferase